MRRAVTAGVTAALALSVGAGYRPDVSSSGTARQSGPAAAAGERAAAARTRTIEFGGYVLTVPAGWPVYRLAADPHRCVRFDVHAVYLGHPGPDQQCPAHLVGHADALWLDATGSPAPRPAAPGSPGAAPAVPGGAARRDGPSAVSAAAAAQAPAATTMVSDAGDGEVRAAVRDAGLSITATYGTGAAAVERIIQSVRLAPDPPRRPARTPAKHGRGRTAIRTTADRTVPPGHPQTPPRGRAQSAPRGRAGSALRGHARTKPRGHSRTKPRGHSRTKPRGHGRTTRRRPAHGAATYPSSPAAGFDTCNTPSAGAMRAWKGRASVIAVYIGGADRACANGNLSASWVREVRAEGWHLIPAYVGLQPSCDHFGGRIDPHNAASEGRAAADDAISQAGRLGIGSGAPLYYDMEDYDTHNSTCRTGVLTFLGAWTRELHSRGYVSGVYSSARSGASDLANTDSVGGHALAKPDSIWIGFWDGKDNLSAAPYVPGSAWTGRRRVKQYRGSHWETAGKVRLNIDSDCVYGPVYLPPAYASATDNHAKYNYDVRWCRHA